MIHPKHILRDPVRPMTLMPDALSDKRAETTLRSCDNPKVNPAEHVTPDVQIPVTFADSVGGEATSQVVDVHVLSTEDGSIDGLSLKKGNVPKATWKDPYGEGEK